MDAEILRYLSDLFHAETRTTGGAINIASVFVVAVIKLEESLHRLWFGALDWLDRWHQSALRARSAKRLGVLYTPPPVDHQLAPPESDSELKLYLAILAVTPVCAAVVQYVADK